MTEHIELPSTDIPGTIDDTVTTSSNAPTSEEEMIETRFEEAIRLIKEYDHSTASKSLSKQTKLYRNGADIKKEQLLRFSSGYTQERIRDIIDQMLGLYETAAYLSEDQSTHLIKSRYDALLSGYSLAFKLTQQLDPSASAEYLKLKFEATTRVVALIEDEAPLDALPYCFGAANQARMLQKLTNDESWKDYVDQYKELAGKLAKRIESRPKGNSNDST